MQDEFTLEISDVPDAANPSRVWKFPHPKGPARPDPDCTKIMIPQNFRAPIVPSAGRFGPSADLSLRRIYGTDVASEPSCVLQDWRRRETAIQPLKILVADDEFLVRWSLTESLSREGYEVTAVENGIQAVETAKLNHFDFIITDLIMPGLEGWEVMDSLHDLPKPPRVIIITAYDKERTREIASEKGAWAYVEKPFLIKEIKKLLSESSRPGDSNF
jgi:CheY-like chemotaxis protein